MSQRITVVTRQATERNREQGTENREKKERESASTAERGETHMGTTREVKKACRSVPSQWYHSGDTTSNRERARKREREGEWLS